MRGFPTPSKVESPVHLPSVQRKGGQHEKRERRKKRRSPLFTFRLHPLFCALGIWYACTGELFLFLLSTLVALQHECAHAFAAAKLGYKLNAVVLMPFGAIVDGDLKGLSLKDEIFVALCGPLCNLCTAVVFAASWWFAPTMYAFTDVACYSSLAIALVNLLPCYPLDGGRVLRCCLTRAFLKKYPQTGRAEKKAERICRAFTLTFALLFFVVFAVQCLRREPNFTLLAFGGFLFVGGVGNRDKSAIYERVDFSFAPSLEKGVEIRRVAVAASCPVKDALRFVCKGSYLVLEVFDGEKHLFDLPQNALSSLFLRADSPYEPLRSLWEKGKNEQKKAKFE